MASSFLDVCRFSPTAGGTADWTYLIAVTGYQSPAAAGAVNGAVYSYRAESTDLSQWEVGFGAYNTGTGVLARTTVLFNSAGTTAKINFSAAPQIAIVALKEDLLSIEEANSFTATQKARGRANLDALKKNYIINGAMLISQENGTSAGTSNNYYQVDQFRIAFSNGGAVSVAQVASDTPGGSTNRSRVTVTTADAAVAAGDFSRIDHFIEGYKVADLLFGTPAAKAITIQFGVKAPAGTYCVVAVNSAGNRSYVAEYVISGGEANTDVVKSVTIPGDTSGTWLRDASVGLRIRWGLMAGSSQQQSAGSWSTGDVTGSSSQFNIMGTLGNVFELFDVGLYEGSAAPSFQVPDYADDLAQCQRYYNKIAIYQELPVTNGADYSFPSYFPPMRATPSGTASDTTSANLGAPIVVGIASPSAVYYRKRASSTGAGLIQSILSLNARL